jgi:UDP-N-acetylmuramate dehydrogenase
MIDTYMNGVGGISMHQLISDLRAAHITHIVENESLAPYTTWKIGGPADLFVIAESKSEIQQMIKLFSNHNVPWTVLGRGSNVLIADKGIRGAVILLGKAFETVRFENNLVISGSAFSLIKLSVLAAKEGLTGLEFAGGIPGSVGGAAYMNAGAHGSDMANIVKHVELINDTGEIKILSNKDMQYVYRHSILHDNLGRGIVTEVVFELAPGDRKEIAAAMASYKDRRLRTQPLQLACAGSVFRNPVNHFAAKLIEEAGLKGIRVGGAEVSPLHANFIVNVGQSTAEDVLSLMSLVQQKILDQYGVELIPEVMVIGER